MQENAVVDAVRVRIRRRRKLSIENHIHRIRLATAIRMSEVFLGTIPKIHSSQNSIIWQNPSFSGNRQKCHLNCVQSEFPEDFYNNKYRHKLTRSTIYITRKRRTSSISPNRRTRRCRILGSINLNLGDKIIESSDDENSCIPLNPFSSEDEGNNSGQESNELSDKKEACQSEVSCSSGANSIHFENEIIEIAVNGKCLNLNDNLLSEDKKDKTKEVCANKNDTFKAGNIQEDNSDSGSGLQKVPDCNQVINSKSTHSSVDSKCGFKTDFGERCENKESFNPNYDNSSEEFIIINLLQDKTCTSHDEGENATDKVAVDGNLHITENKTHSETQTSEKDFDDFPLVEKDKNDMNLQTLNTETDSTTEFAKYMSNVEIRVSPIGDLQIVLNSNCTPTDDAKIVITEDDVLKTRSVPEFHLHLNDVPESCIDQLEDSTVVTERQTEPNCEIVPISKSLSFPLAANTQNTALHSRFKMRSLSILYKRSDICHVTSASNKDKK